MRRTVVVSASAGAAGLVDEAQIAVAGHAEAPVMVVDAARGTVAPPDSNGDLEPFRGRERFVPGGLADDVREEWADPGEPRIGAEDKSGSCCR